MADYYVKVVNDSITNVYRSGGFPSKMAGYLPDSDGGMDLTYGVNLNKLDPSYYPGFNVYPCTLTGEGNLPDKSSIVWDAQSMTASGALVPVPPSRVISFRAFYTKMIASGANMDEIYAAAKTDVKVEQFLDLARNAQEGSTIDLDDAMTIAGIDYLVADANCPSITAAVKTAVLA